jgi:ribokinase
MKVLNFGSLNIDYVYDVEHFVRAGETISSKGLQLFCGGKGLNQSVAFARAGADTYHAGCVGKDGGMLLDMLKGAGADVRFVKTLQEVSTGHAIIQVSEKGENCILLHGGANQSITHGQVDEVLAAFGAGDLLMLQNEINDLEYIIKAAKARGMFIVLNPSPFDAKITALDLSLLDAIIVNETEGCGLSGKTEPQEILDELLARYPAMKIVLTLGKQGAIYADATQRASCPIMQIPVVDTTAAGDTFTGYFFAGLLGGATPADALRTATAASTLAVSRKGAAPSIPTAQEVAAFLLTQA